MRLFISIKHIEISLIICKDSKKKSHIHFVMIFYEIATILIDKKNVFLRQTNLIEL